MRALLADGTLAGGDGTSQPGVDRLSAPGQSVHYRVTEQGAARLRVFGIDVDALGRRPRPLLRYCADWSEQRHHLAGGLGAALAQRMFELDWIRRSAHSRAVTITSAGAAGLHATFGLLTEELAERHAGS